MKRAVLVFGVTVQMRPLAPHCTLETGHYHHTELPWLLTFPIGLQNPHQWSGGGQGRAEDITQFSHSAVLLSLYYAPPRRSYCLWDCQLGVHREA